MNQRLLKFLENLYADGAKHDRAQPDRLLKRRNLEPDTADLLSMVVRIASARTVVERTVIQQSGSLMRWATLAETVVSVDTASLDEARNNLASADTVQPGLATRVEFRQEDGGAYLARLADGSVDLLFLDAERSSTRLVAAPGAHSASGRCARDRQRLVACRRGRTIPEAVGS